jgi:hypothetical protein
MRGVCAMNFEAMNILDPATGVAPESFELGSFGGDLTDASIPLAQTPVPIPAPTVHTPPPDHAMTPSTVPEASVSVVDEKMADSPKPLPLTEIVNMVPPESKEHKWKPAPVAGKPITATPLISDTACLPTILPADSGVSSGPAAPEGKTIRVAQGKSFRESDVQTSSSNQPSRVVVNTSKTVTVRTAKRPMSGTARK